MAISLIGCCFCTKQDEEVQLQNQDQAIDAYITSEVAAAKAKRQDTVITVAHKGVTNRIVWNPQVGDTLAAGDSLVFYYVAHIFSSGKGGTFATNISELVDEKSWPISEYPEDYGRNTVGTGYYLPGLDAGLIGMRAGEYAYIMFTSQYGYGNKQMGIVPKMSPLFFEVWVDHIEKRK